MSCSSPYASRTHRWWTDKTVRTWVAKSGDVGEASGRSETLTHRVEDATARSRKSGRRVSTRSRSEARHRGSLRSPTKDEAPVLGTATTASFRGTSQALPASRGGRRLEELQTSAREELGAEAWQTCCESVTGRDFTCCPLPWCSACHRRCLICLISNQWTLVVLKFRLFATSIQQYTPTILRTSAILGASWAKAYTDTCASLGFLAETSDLPE